MRRALPEAIALDASNLYWADHEALMKWPLAGGSPSTLVPYLPALEAVSIATDGVSVYWLGGVVGSSLGTVVKVSVAGGASTTLASGQLAPYGIAVDSTSVYWGDQEHGFNAGDAMVMRLTPK